MLAHSRCSRSAGALPLPTYLSTAGAQGRASATYLPSEFGGDNPAVERKVQGADHGLERQESSEPIVHTPRAQNLL